MIAGLILSEWGWEMFKFQFLNWSVVLCSSLQINIVFLISIDASSMISDCGFKICKLLLIKLMRSWTQFVNYSTV